METNKGKLNEWQQLFDLCHRPPSGGLEIGAIVIPTGTWADHLRVGVEFFKERFKSQRELPFLVVSGRWSDEDVAQKRVRFASRAGEAGELIGTFEIFNQLSAAMKKKLVVEPEATNTKEQAENVYKLLQKEQIKPPLVIVVSGYHLPRFVGTLVKTILDKEGDSLKTKIYTLPAYLDWEEIARCPGKETRENKIDKEVKKIHQYRKKGDVATNKELKRYINWLGHAVTPGKRFEISPSG